MNIEEVRDYCLSLPQATEDIPFGKFGSDDVAFRIAGKIFAFLLVDDSRMVVLKSDADRALELRANYPGAIEPAFHWNKKYWNQVYYESAQLNSNVIEGLIAESYGEVLKKLPRKTRESILQHQ